MRGRGWLYADPFSLGIRQWSEIETYPTAQFGILLWALVAMVRAGHKQFVNAGGEQHVTRSILETTIPHRIRPEPPSTGQSHPRILEPYHIHEAH